MFFQLCFLLIILYAIEFFVSANIRTKKTQRNYIQETENALTKKFRLHIAYYVIPLYLRGG